MTKLTRWKQRPKDACTYEGPYSLHELKYKKEINVIEKAC